MTELMNWFYDYYIKPHIESQPKSDGEFFRISLFESDLTPQQLEESQAVMAYYATHGFCLGLKMGLTLGEDLRK